MSFFVMKKLICLPLILLILVSCSEEPEPDFIYSARISGTPGLSFNGFGRAFQTHDTTNIVQDFIGNIPFNGDLVITFGDDIKGIEVTVQKENDLGELKLEVFVNDAITDSASTVEPQGVVSLSAGETN